MNKNDFEKYRHLYLDLGVKNNEIVYDYNSVTVPIIGPYAKNIKIDFDFYNVYMQMTIISKHDNVFSPNYFIIQKWINDSRLNWKANWKSNNTKVSYVIRNIQDILTRHKLNNKFIEYHSPLIKNKIINYISNEIIHCNKAQIPFSLIDENNFYELQGLLILS